MTKFLHNHAQEDGPVKVGAAVSRRGFLNSFGIAAVGGLAVAAGGVLLTDRDAKAEIALAAPALPWKYTKLDPLEAGKRGYKNYLEKGG